MNEIFNIILTTFKNKRLIIFVALLSIILVFKANFTSEYTILLDGIEEIITVLSRNIIVVILTIFFSGSLLALLKYSHRIYQNDLDNRYANYQKFDSNESTPFKVWVIEDAKYITYNEKPYRRFVVQNNTGEELEYCSCQINLYSNKEKMMEVPLESKWIQHGYKISTEKIYKDYNLLWDEFDLFIIKAKYKNDIIENMRFCFTKIYMIPPNIIHRNLIDRLLPWDLNWFKRNVLYFLFNYIRHVYTSVVYMPPNPDKSWKKSRFLNKFRKVYITLFLLVIIPCILLYLYLFGSIVYEIIRIIISLFNDIVRNLFSI